MQIERVEVSVVAPRVQRFTWSHNLPEQYMTNTIVRITTDDGNGGVGGVSNYTSYDYDRYTCETLRHMIPALVGNFVWPTAYECLLLLGVGLSTQFLQVALTKGLKLVPAGPATALLYVQVLFAAIWGLVFFEEALDALTILGAGLILAGTVSLFMRRSDHGPT